MYQLPPWLAITAAALAVLSFASVFVLHLRSAEATSRVPKSTFWAWLGCLFAVALFCICLVHSGLAEKHPEVIGLPLLLLWFPVLIAGVIIQIKRWHDRNKSGWWILINLVPYLGQVWAFIELGFFRGTKGPNRFGPDPLAAPPPHKPLDTAHVEGSASQRLAGPPLS